VNDLKQKSTLVAELHRAQNHASLIG